MNKRKIIMVAVAVLIGAVLNSPWLAEGGSNNCGAFERLALRAVAQKEGRDPGLLVQGLVALSDGRAAAAGVSKEWPNVPSPLACAYGYWNGRVNGLKP